MHHPTNNPGFLKSVPQGCYVMIATSKNSTKEILFKGVNHLVSAYMMNFGGLHFCVEFVLIAAIATSRLAGGTG